jgi:hypothetical protein
MPIILLARIWLGWIQPTIVRTCGTGIPAFPWWCAAKAAGAAAVSSAATSAPVFTVVKAFLLDRTIPEM